MSASRLEADWSQHFADRLSSPDGLELVVEVAHDLRSPLTSILFLAETLQRARSGPVNPVQERQLGLIYSAAFGLSSVASDVIELARGGDRLVDLDPIPFSVTDILESVRDIVQPIAEEKSLAVQLTAPEADFRIGHPVALSRVLLNLTTNALKFTAEGFVEVIALETGSRAVEFSVRDTGRGIPPQSMATLYEPFRRRQKPGEYAFSGSGLGLSICRKLVEAMGSTLEVETAPGYGTRFHFALDLPLAGEPQLGVSDRPYPRHPNTHKFFGLATSGTFPLARPGDPADSRAAVDVIRSSTVAAERRPLGGPSRPRTLLDALPRSGSGQAPRGGRAGSRGPELSAT